MQLATDEGKTKASFAIAAQFRSRIARGDLREGQPLPVESDLVAQLGVSKGVVREALRILETEGLVEVRRGLGGGPRVRHPSIHQVAKGMGVYLQIGDVLVTDVWEVRDRLIGGAVERLTAQRHRGMNLDGLEAAVSNLGDVVGDFVAFYPQLLDVGEEAVRTAGSATEQLIVVSLRQVIAAELAAATQAAVGSSPTVTSQALAAEEEIARDWSEVVRNARARRVRSARLAYERQATLVRAGLWDQMKDVTVGEAVLATSARHSCR